MPALMMTLSPDAELVSPLSGRMVFRGAADLEILLTGVYGMVRAWHWEQPLGEGRRRVLVGDGKVGPFKLGDAMMVELDEAGLIRRLRPHLRPFLGLIAFAVLLGPKLAGHPAMLLRALRG
jgi:hypothetical protein